MDATGVSYSTPTKKRRSFQYSLRMLLVFMLLLGIGMSWFAVKMRRAENQEKAVQRIRLLGGGVLYHYQIVDDDGNWREEVRNGIRIVNPYPPLPPAEPDWLRRLLGEDFLSPVVSVWLDGVPEAIFPDGTCLDTQVTDADLAVVAEGIPQLWELRLERTDITDAGLAHLKEMNQLHTLVLYGTQITDAGLAHVKEMPHLAHLNLGGTQITDAGLTHLKDMAQLQFLALGGTQVTGEGVKRLQESLPNCTIHK